MNTEKIEYIKTIIFEELDDLENDTCNVCALGLGSYSNSKCKKGFLKIAGLNEFCVKYVNSLIINANNRRKR